MTIFDYGWNQALETQFQPFSKQNLAPARVTAVWSWHYEKDQDKTQKRPLQRLYARRQQSRLAAGILGRR